MQDFFYWANTNIINIEYSSNKKNPSILSIIPFLGKNAINKTKTVNTSIHMISLLKISKSSITIGLIIAVIPKTEPILKIFEPIKFKATDSVEEITLALNSWLEKMIIKNPSKWIWSHDRWI